MEHVNGTGLLLTDPVFALSRVSITHQFSTGYTAHLLKVSPSLYVDIERALRENRPAPAVPAVEMDTGLGPITQENPLDLTYQAALKQYDQEIQTEALRAFVDALIEEAIIINDLPTLDVMRAMITRREDSVRQVTGVDAFTLSGATIKAKFVRNFVSTGKELDEALELITGRVQPVEGALYVHTDRS